MRNSLLVSAAVLGLTLPALAQNSTSTMSPPSPNSAMGMPQPANSVPEGAATATRPPLPGSALGGTTPQGMPGNGASMGSRPGSAMTGMQPLRHPAPHHRYSGHREGMNNERRGGEGHAQRGMMDPNGQPRSRAASNIDNSDTRGKLAPRLPVPPVNGDTPSAYLAAANRALARHQTGAAQEALERAETRLLDRSVPPGQANMPARDPRLAQISAARRALASNDLAGARRSIQEAMNSQGGGQGNMGQAGMQPGAMQPGMGNNGAGYQGMGSNGAMGQGATGPGSMGQGSMGHGSMGQGSGGGLSR